MHAYLLYNVFQKYKIEFHPDFNKSIWNGNVKKLKLLKSNQVLNSKNKIKFDVLVDAGLKINIQ